MLGLIGFAFLAALIGTVGIQGQADQRFIAEQLLAADLAIQVNGLTSAERIGTENIGPELRSALIMALNRAGEMVRQQSESVEQGRALLRDDEAEAQASFMFALIPVVGLLRDPMAIPGLASLLELQPGSIEALADYGEASVLPLVDMLGSSRTREGQIHGALITLRFIVEAPEYNLTERSRNQIRQAAEQYLFRKDPIGAGAVLNYTIDLAIALNDSKLRAVVETLSTDREAFLMRGIADSRAVQRIQQHAVDRLRGVPAVPHRLGLAGYLQRRSGR